jgi:hypothetical protein
MIRKSFFWGLTLVLIIALISLIVRSRRLEKQQVGKSEGVIQESKPTPTRVLAPQDLEIVQLLLRLEKESDGKNQSQTAWHEMEIHNKGKVSYSSILLAINYVDRGGKLLATKNHYIKKIIIPRDVLKLADIKITGLPVHTASCRVEITCADIESASQSH